MLHCTYCSCRARGLSTMIVHFNFRVGRRVASRRVRHLPRHAFAIWAVSGNMMPRRCRTGVRSCGACRARDWGWYAASRILAVSRCCDGQTSRKTSFAISWSNGALCCALCTVHDQSSHVSMCVVCFLQQTRRIEIGVSPPFRLAPVHQTGRRIV